MPNNVLNNILNAYTKYCLGPIILTVIFTIVLFSSHDSSQNFDLITMFCGYTTMISGLLLAVCTHNLLNGKKNCLDLFALAFISVVMSMMTVLFFKTYSFLSSFAMVSAIASAFIFFTIFKKIIKRVQE